MIFNREQHVGMGFAILPFVLISQINGIYLAALARIGPPWYWAADLIQWIVLPLLAVMFLAKRGVLPKHYGLETSNQNWDWTIIYSFGVFATAGLMYFMAHRFAWHLFDQPKGYFSLASVFPGGSMRTVVWIYASVTAGLIESIVYIGLPWLWYSSVKPDHSRLGFSIVVSLIFAFAHWEQGPHAIVASTFYHVVACAWYFKLPTLWPIVIGHMLIDLVAFA